MILTRRVVAGLTLCVALSTVATVYYGGLATAPQLLFGGDDVFLVSPPGGKLVGTATVPAGLAGALRSLDHVESVSAEVYVPTSVDERSVLARGVEWEEFAQMERAVIVDGRAPAGPRDAIAGEGFAKSMRVKPGDHLLLPGSASRTGLRVEIVGIAEMAGPAREELLVTLEAARGLAKVSADEAHLIRVQTGNRSQVKALVESISPSFTYSDVRLSSLAPLPGEPVLMRANLTNWGRVDAVKIVEVRNEGDVVAERAYRVPALATIPIEVEFSLQHTGRQNVTINPTFLVDVGSANITLTDVPSHVVANQSFRVRVLDSSGAPVVAARVADGRNETTTDDAGVANLTLDAPGRHLLRATSDETSEVAVATVYVVQRGLERQASGVVVDLALGAVDYGTKRAIPVRALVENRGGMTGNVSVPLRVAGNVSGFANATLDPGDRAWVELAIKPPPAGNHTLTATNGTGVARFRTVEGEDPRIQALLRGYDERAARPAFSATSGDSADDYVKRTVGNLGAAAIILSIATGGLATIGAVAVLSRHIGDRRASLGIAKSIGARNAYLIDVATWEAARYGAIASALGVTLGALAAVAIDATGIVRAFGHAIHPDLSWSTLGLILLVGVLVLVVASRLLVRNALEAPADDLLRAARSAADQPELLAVVEARR